MAAPKISKVVIFFLENHTTDNVASEVPGVNGNKALPLAPDIVVPDPAHDHGHWDLRKTPSPGGARRERFSAAQLPSLYKLMNEFTVCDNYFADFAGNSFPNHCFAIGADAEWAYANPGHRYAVTIATPGVPVRLTHAKKTWANYGKGFAFAQYADPQMHKNVKKSEQFAADARAGHLPNVSWVYAPPGQDFHPGPLGHGSSMKASDAWLGAAVDAVRNGPDWASSMIFITFDDWGGWDDHVDPPNVEQFPKGSPWAGEQYRYGSRVPCIVVGPFAKAKYVSHQQLSHTSLVAFIERLWNLPTTTPPDARKRTTRCRIATRRDSHVREQLIAGRFTMTDTSTQDATTSPGFLVSGMDVSHHQGSIDWGQVAAQAIAFAFVKATEGLGTDPAFTTNWSGANQAGILRGAYHFFRPKLPAVDQARHFCEVVGSLGVRDLPPVLDVESTPGPSDDWDALPTQDARAKAVTDWLVFVSGALQKTPILYTYRSFWQLKFGVASAFASYPLWIAAYSNAPVVPAGWRRWTFWQHTEKGQVGGINGSVDLDKFNGTMNDLEKFAQAQNGGPTDEAAAPIA